MQHRHQPPAHYRRVAARKAERNQAAAIKPIGHDANGNQHHRTQAAAREILKQGGHNAE
jgi:hypothetical protein